MPRDTAPGQSPESKKTPPDNGVAGKSRDILARAEKDLRQKGMRVNLSYSGEPEVLTQRVEAPKPVVEVTERPLGRTKIPQSPKASPETAGRPVVNGRTRIPQTPKVLTQTEKDAALVAAMQGLSDGELLSGDGRAAKRAEESREKARIKGIEREAEAAAIKAAEALAESGTVLDYTEADARASVEANERASLTFDSVKPVITERAKENAPAVAAKKTKREGVAQVATAPKIPEVVATSIDAPNREAKTPKDIGSPLARERAMREKREADSKAAADAALAEDIVAIHVGEKPKSTRSTKATPAKQKFNPLALERARREANAPKGTTQGEAAPVAKNSPSAPQAPVVEYSYDGIPSAEDITNTHTQGPGVVPQAPQSQEQKRAPNVSPELRAKVLADKAAPGDTDIFAEKEPLKLELKDTIEYHELQDARKALAQAQKNQAEESTWDKRFVSGLKKIFSLGMWSDKKRADADQSVADASKKWMAAFTAYQAVQKSFKQQGPTAGKEGEARIRTHTPTPGPSVFIPPSRPTEAARDTGAPRVETAVATPKPVRETPAEVLNNVVFPELRVLRQERAELDTPQERELANRLAEQRATLLVEEALKGARAALASVEALLLARQAAAAQSGVGAPRVPQNAAPSVEPIPLVSASSLNVYSQLMPQDARQEKPTAVKEREVTPEVKPVQAERIAVPLEDPDFPIAQAPVIPTREVSKEELERAASTLYAEDLRSIFDIPGVWSRVGEDGLLRFERTLEWKDAAAFMRDSTNPAAADAMSISKREMSNLRTFIERARDVHNLTIEGTLKDFMKKVAAAEARILTSGN